MAAAYTTTSAVHPSAYDVITDRICTLLEQGVVPWHKPWGSRNADGSVAFPRNLISGHVYRGINLWLTMSAGYSSQYWLTFKQAVSLGGHVRQGEHGTPICFWKFGTSEEQDPEGKITERQWALCRYYTVFNLQQCEVPGLKLTSEVSPDAPRFEPITECERVVDGWAGRPPIRYGGNRACYQPLADRISMPVAESFAVREEFYSTLFHEMGHATGHASRLNREGITEAHFFGDQVYSKEELVAEMTAAYLCGITGIENHTITNSAAYIASWLKKLRDDRRLVVVAASQAQKAADLILGNVARGEQVERPAPGPMSVLAAAPAQSPAPAVQNVDNITGINGSNVLCCASSPAAILPPTPSSVSAPAVLASQVSLAVPKSTCPYVTLQTEHGAMVIDRKKYQTALRGLQVLSATCSKSGSIRVLTVVHGSGTLKFYNQLDVDGCNTNRRLREWADKERRREAERQKACRWKTEASVQRKWIGERVVWVPRNEDSHNRIAGHVTELLVHPATGQKGCVITDDHGRQHRVWDRQGALYKPADAPTAWGEVRQLPAAAEAAKAMAA